MKGNYVLLIALDKDTAILVGKLGIFSFPAGYYLYVGSAMAGLSHRISRHLREEKKSRWHIDYLLKYSRIVDVWYAQTDERWECLWAQAAFALPQAHVMVPGFGSSDCRCPSHLIYCPDKPNPRAFRHKLGQLSDRQIPLLSRLLVPDGC